MKAMQTQLESQYGYFLRLEQMVKTALAVYGAVLVTGALAIALGIDSIIEEVLRGNYRLLVLIVFGTVGIFLGTFTLVGKVRWISKLNIWLDRTFFKILDRSNTILSDTLFDSVDSDFQQSHTFSDDQNKHSFAQDIFRRLAGDDHLFQYLLESNIFRFWIWYWILLYGSFTFTLLTAALFTSVALGVTVATKSLFASFWFLALLHIGLGYFLGNHLIRVTQSTATKILNSYRDEIAAMLKGSMPGVQRPANEH